MLGTSRKQANQQLALSVFVIAVEFSTHLRCSSLRWERDPQRSRRISTALSFKQDEVLTESALIEWHRTWNFLERADLESGSRVWLIGRALSNRECRLSPLHEARDRAILPELPSTSR